MTKISRVSDVWVMLPGTKVRVITNNDHPLSKCYSHTRFDQCTTQMFSVFCVN